MRPGMILNETTTCTKNVSTKYQQTNESLQRTIDLQIYKYTNFNTKIEEKKRKYFMNSFLY